jgi:hypothetical protein
VKTSWRAEKVRLLLLLLLLLLQLLLLVLLLLLLLLPSGFTIRLVSGLVRLPVCRIRRLAIRLVLGLALLP